MDVNGLIDTRENWIDRRIFCDGATYQQELDRVICSADSGDAPVQRRRARIVHGLQDEEAEMADTVWIELFGAPRLDFHHKHSCGQPNALDWRGQGAPPRLGFSETPPRRRQSARLARARRPAARRGYRAWRPSR